MISEPTYIIEWIDCRNIIIIVLYYYIKFIAGKSPFLSYVETKKNVEK